jgi:hypothetical protein
VGIYEFNTCIDPPIITSNAFSPGVIDSVDVGGEGGGTGIVIDLLDFPDFPPLL